MLFARFLAENGLLREDEGDQPIDLDECRALAVDRRLDIWVYAALCAQKMLPGVFRLDDPALELKLDGAAQVELNTLMAGLQPEIFKATDALGWVYQYWQAKRKDEVNASGVKIGAKEISPVTQLFTEDYMVDFLLHNTLGAWWAGKMGPIEAATEEEARAKAGLFTKDGLPAVVWTYLRFIQDAETKKWTPAGGTFDGWPKKAKDITFLDPCMGSGHFPVFALPILARMRMEEERGTAAENIHAVLKDQIHGLELDQRCCQIGAFNLALTAWKIAGFQQLPPLNVACCGIAPRAKLEDWVKLAGSNEKLKVGMARLYSLFEQAHVLGSLINPRIEKGDLFVAAFHELQPLLEKALVQEAEGENLHEMTVAACDMAKAAEILVGRFALVATNVPYLGMRKQCDGMRDFCDREHPASRADLATCFIERCAEFCISGGTSTFVTPHNWLFLTTYTAMRERMLAQHQWNFVTKLGARAFQMIGGEVVNVVLIGVTNATPTHGHLFLGLDVSNDAGPYEKSKSLIQSTSTLNEQLSQLKQPDARIMIGGTRAQALLSDYAYSAQGIGTTDNPRFVQCFWEQLVIAGEWETFQSGATESSVASGCSTILRWGGPGRDYFNHIEALRNENRIGGGWQAGGIAWGRDGFAVNVTGTKVVTGYSKGKFDTTIGVIIPHDKAHEAAILSYIQSERYSENLSVIDPTLSVTEGTLIKVSFDLAHWQKVAEERYPHGLPKPFSNDPTQWLFSGHPFKSYDPLQVAVARLLCYQWPRQTGSTFPDCSALEADGLEKHADDDGVVPLSAINREEAAATRVYALLKAAYGAEWQEGVTERQLLADTGNVGVTLEDWLRDSFFEEHCKLFQHRPFVWHIWDGERDGFHALVNYHRLAAPNGEGARLLQKLAQTYLGDWIARCEADDKNDKPNAHKLLKAAKDLQADLLKILEGEAPHDVFVRWKPLHEQSIGWNPDINDGVRLNIRPFLTVRDVGKKGAGVLRWKPNIKWDKDRGSEPQRPKAQFPWFFSCLPKDKPDHVTDFAGGAEFTGERWNNLHYTLAAKKAARAKFTPKK